MRRCWLTPRGIIAHKVFLGQFATKIISVVKILQESQNGDDNLGGQAAAPGDLRKPAPRRGR